VLSAAEEGYNETATSKYLFQRVSNSVERQKWVLSSAVESYSA
jgi:hypothetical protein